MKCPGCHAEMQETVCGAIKLDVCRSGCGGLWFDERELISFDNGSEFDPTPLLKLEKVGQGGASADSTPRKCSKCSDQVLVRQFYDVQGKVVIDQCWGCSGIFLDNGELQTLRSQFASAQDQSAAVAAHAADAVQRTERIFDRVRKERKQRAELERSESRLTSLVKLIDQLILKR